MKKYILLPMIFMLLAKYTSAQMGALNGSGKIVTKDFAYKNFEKVFIKDFNGKVEIESGKAFSINISIDDNLEKLLDVSEDDGELKISLKGNWSNRLYIENTNIRVKISMPNLIYVHQNGNNSLIAKNIIAKKFGIKCNGNGNATFSGTVNELYITCRGNGTVDTRKLIAEKLTVNRTGNGTVYTNTKNKFTTFSNGNGDIINVGGGKSAEGSVVAGNGNIIIK